MSKAKVRKGQGDDHQLEEALAVLISSTHSKRRLLPLTEITGWLDIAVKKLGGYSAVGERIGLSSKMLRQFGYVQRLSPSVQHLFETRKLDSVDAATYLAMLPQEEQLPVATSLVSGEIDTSDIRAVAQLRKTVGPSPNIHSLLGRVKQSKTKQEYVAEFVVRGQRNRRAIENAFRKFLPKNAILRVEIKGALGRLVLTQSGRTALGKAARTLGVPLKRVIPTMIEGSGRP
jgi:hypothetical protein